MNTKKISSIAERIVTSSDLPSKFWGIVRNKRVVYSGNALGMDLERLSDMAKQMGGEVVFGDAPFHRSFEVGDILGYTWQQIRDMQQGIRPY